MTAGAPGDGLVRPRSATGGALFPDADVLRLRTHHFGLLDHPEIRGAGAIG